MALTPIRPIPVQPPANPSAEAARTAAQRAFFDAALGRTGAAAPTPQTAASAFAPTSAPIQRAQRLPDPAAEPPAKPLRPGSLLDIRI